MEDYTITKDKEKDIGIVIKKIYPLEIIRGQGIFPIIYYGEIQQVGRKI
jgi:hypothetical protein